MNIDIKTRALEMAREIFPNVPVEELIVNATKIEAYLAIKDSLDSLPEFSQQCLIEHPVKGAIHFQPYEGQRAAMQYIQDHKKVLIQSGRQMGTTTMLTFSALWDALRTPMASICVMSNNFTSVQYLRDRISFTCGSMKAGFARMTTNNKQQIVFSNGSTISFVVPSGNALRGRTINALYIDQAGFVSHNSMDEFWMSCAPCLATGARIYMASSGKSASKGVFYDLWAEDNDFVKVELPWFVHPERDATWEQDMINMIGNDAFRREYECGFKTP